MAVEVKENHTGRRATSRAAERTYYIKGAADENSAREALLTDGEVPTLLDVGANIVLPRIDAECGVEELEAGRYLGTAVYRSPDTVIFQQPNSFSISFDISGQSTRVTHSKATVAAYGPADNSATPKDFRGAINVQQDGTIDGTDIIVPFLTYAVTYTFLNSDITSAYVNTLAAIVGTVNNAAFHGYAAGELLLTRVSGQKRTDGSGNWDITFGFSVSRNKTTIVIGEQRTEGGAITVPGDAIIITSKRGWDFLWVRYEEKQVGSAAAANWHKVPVSAYVEQMYEYTSYAALNI
jgi:hypothetical protein